MMPPAANRHPSGFTLIEVVIALTVLGFLFVGLAQGVRFGLAAWSAEVRRTGGEDDFRTLDKSFFVNGSNTLTMTTTATNSM